MVFLFPFFLACGCGGGHAVVRGGAVPPCPVVTAWRFRVLSKPHGPNMIRREHLTGECAPHVPAARSRPAGHRSAMRAEKGGAPWVRGGLGAAAVPHGMG